MTLSPIRQPHTHLSTVLTSPDWQEYELLDCGGGAKLERYGEFIISRPEAEAIWQPALSETEWKKADAAFYSSNNKNGGYWIMQSHMPERWQIAYKELKCWLQIANSKQIGLFPEQACQWQWIEKQVKLSLKPLKILNLFGYTGLATLAAAGAGASVTHIDASKKAISWARENQQLSNLAQSTIRWIIDDALKFVQREKRRSSFYDGIILDPPKFGRGPQGEVWEFYKLLPSLLDACHEIISPSFRFIMLTAYAVKASSITLRQALESFLGRDYGNFQAGEIALLEKSAGRLLPTAIYASWSAEKSG